MLRGTGRSPSTASPPTRFDAFRAAVDAIERGECVAFYPEGTLTRDPDLWPMTGKTGAARVAAADQGARSSRSPSGAPTRRCRRTPRRTRSASSRARRLRCRRARRSTSTAFYGQEPTPEVLQAATEDIMAAITDLLEEVRGETGPRRSRTIRAKSVAQQRRKADRGVARRGDAVPPLRRRLRHRLLGHRLRHGPRRRRLRGDPVGPPRRTRRGDQHHPHQPRLSARASSSRRRYGRPPTPPRPRRRRVHRARRALPDPARQPRRLGTAAARRTPCWSP